MNNVWAGLHSKGVEIERGHVAGKLDVKQFLRELMKQVKDKKAQFQFRARLCNHDEDFSAILPEAELHDLFVVSNREMDRTLATENLNIEILETPTFSEVRYLLHLDKSL